MAEKTVLVDLNLNGNSIKESTFEKLSAAPTTDVFVGRMYFDTTRNCVMRCVAEPVQAVQAVQGVQAAEGVQGVQAVEGVEGKDAVWIEHGAMTSSVKKANMRSLEEVATLHGGVFPENYTLQDFISELYRKVLPVQWPTTRVLPTMSLKMTQGKTVEVNPYDTVGAQFVIEFNSFSQGQIGTMSHTDGESNSTETKQNSGCTKVDGSLKIYSSADSYTQAVSDVDGKFYEYLAFNQEGSNSTKIYKGTVNYTGSTAKSANSYGKDCTAQYAIAPGTTAKSATVGANTLTATFYKFFSGADSSAWTKEGTYPGTNSLVQKKLGKGKVYYAFAKVADGDVLGFIPSNWTIAFRQFGTDNNQYATWGTGNYNIEDKYVAKMPTGGNPSKIINIGGAEFEARSTQSEGDKVISLEIAGSPTNLYVANSNDWVVGDRIRYTYQVQVGEETVDATVKFAYQGSKWESYTDNDIKYKKIIFNGPQGKQQLEITLS